MGTRHAYKINVRKSCVGMLSNLARFVNHRYFSNAFIISGVITAIKISKCKWKVKKFIKNSSR